MKKYIILFQLLMVSTIFSNPFSSLLRRFVRLSPNAQTLSIFGGSVCATLAFKNMYRNIFVKREASIRTELDEAQRELAKARKSSESQEVDRLESKVREISKKLRNLE